MKTAQNNINKEQIYKTISDYKQKYMEQGFIILGVFGSFARDMENSHSDIDLLFELSESFLQKYPGWYAYEKLEEIKKELESVLQHPVDLADKDSLSNTGKKYILSEVVYVP